MRQRAIGNGMPGRKVRMMLVVALGLAAGLVVACGAGPGTEGTRPLAVPAATRTIAWDFEDVPAGQLPEGWHVGATGKGRPLATWEVVPDESAPSGKQVLALTRTNHSSGRTFNLCWTDRVTFRDGVIRVKFRANTGRIDQGGGITWRFQDEDNYYVARFNPLEDNFRYYRVKDGWRHLLLSADVHLEPGWHEMKIVQLGNRFEGWLDGKRLLAGTDDTFPGAGKVGLWTKADAVTSFDDFTVELFGDDPGEGK